MLVGIGFPGVQARELSRGSGASDVSSGKVPLFGSDGYLAEHSLFNKLELGLTLGSTGIGLELATPVTGFARLRAGFDYMPPVNVPMDFSMTAVKDGVVNEGNFDRIRELMTTFTGFEIDRDIRMNCKPTLRNFKLLADVFPFAKVERGHWRNLRVTVGLYAGPSRVGKTVNDMTEMPSLLMVGLYNRMYETVMDPDFKEWAYDNPILPGTQIYLDPETVDVLKEKMEAYGRLGMKTGYYADGTPYVMEPGKDGTVRANALVDNVKGYAGIGYEGAISDDGRWKAGFDAGAMFWGGSPKVVTHEGVVMNDLHGLPGKVGRTMKLMKAFTVYPVLNFRLSYTFF